MSDKQWSNWSGSVRFRPRTVARPESAEELIDVVRECGKQGRVARPVGSRHSSMPVYATDQTLIAFDHLKGLVSYDKSAGRAVFLPGTTINEAGEQLQKVGLALENMGDIDLQTLAGAYGTGTHGSGVTLQNLPGQLIAARFVAGDGQVHEVGPDHHPERVDALRASLGALGMFLELTVRVMPAVQLRRREWCTGLEQCLEHLDELIQTFRNFDFYWYPRADVIKLRTWNRVGEGPSDLPYARLQQEEVDWSNFVLQASRQLKFEEMEYCLPFEAGPDCFREVRRRVLEKHRQYVAWRVLYRTVAADDGWLSPFHGRKSVTIAILQNNTLPYWPYFEDLEPIFRHHGGRPHWGKKHTLKAAELAPLYPRFNDFRELRRQLDPRGTLLNDHLRKLLGEERDESHG